MPCSEFFFTANAFAAYASGICRRSGRFVRFFGAEILEAPLASSTRKPRNIRSAAASVPCTVFFRVSTCRRAAHDACRGHLSSRAFHVVSSSTEYFELGRRIRPCLVENVANELLLGDSKCSKLSKLESFPTAAPFE